MPLPSWVWVSNVDFNHCEAKFSFSCWVATIEECDPTVTVAGAIVVELITTVLVTDTAEEHAEIVVVDGNTTKK